jgi:hypothetical protein
MPSVCSKRSVPAVNRKAGLPDTVLIEQNYRGGQVLPLTNRLIEITIRFDFKCPYTNGIFWPRAAFLLF